MTLAKLEVGDRVRVNQFVYYSTPQGSEGTVERADLGLYEVRIDGVPGDTWSFFGKELDRIEP